MGATNCVISPEGTEWSGAGHVMGTCRMGLDRSSSVVDANGRSHDHPNLFIAGSSVFPTAGTANPTLTALAVTLRTVRALEAHLKESST
jgi:choline dehydrogenase-like flavoprotein